MSAVTSWKKAAVWLKNYWYFPIIFIAAVFLLLLSRGSNAKMFKLLENQKENYRKEIEAINGHNAKSDRKKKEIVEANKERLEEIEAEYDIKIRDLKGDREQRLQETIKEFENNPQEMAKRIAAILDAHVVAK
jgi:uncharacterized membrane protein YhiD involved in acid resistance